MKIGKTEKILLNSAKDGPLCFTLLDSQSTPASSLPSIIKTIENSKAAAIFIGGSTISDQMEIEAFVNSIKKLTKLPVILFPGNISGVASNADAILFMSLLNSDNPYFITGAQALGSISVKKHNIEPLPTAYIIVGEGCGAGCRAPSAILIKFCKAFPPWVGLGAAAVGLALGLDCLAGC